ncbi:MAG: hypothetical protein AAGA90_11635 [Actinomycetota bacterium]
MGGFLREARFFVVDTFRSRAGNESTRRFIDDAPGAPTTDPVRPPTD